MNTAASTWKDKRDNERKIAAEAKKMIEIFLLKHGYEVRLILYPANAAHG